MGAVPYRSVEQGESEREDERVEEGEYNSFANGDVCRACGAEGARPARTSWALDYRCSDADDRDFAFGRVALCGACAEVQRRANERERALWALSLSCVAGGLVAVFVQRSPSLVVVFAAMVASSIVGWFLDRAIVRRLAVRALVLSVTGTKMRVWLARTGAAKMPLRSPERRRTSVFAFMLAWSSMLMPLVWITANPRVEIESALTGPALLVINRRIAVDLERQPRGYVWLKYGFNRLEFVTDRAIPALELRVTGMNYQRVHVVPPMCESRDSHGQPRQFRYVWLGEGDSHRLDCEFTR